MDAPPTQPKDDSSTGDGRQAELDRLAEEFVRRERSGEKPSITEYVRSHPELAEGIEEIFPLLTAMEDARPARAVESGAQPGSELGDYKLLREIGRGGMGVVYEAEQKTLGRRVALKILPTRATLDPRFLERFRLEAQAAARLQHPHIVPVIGYGLDDGVHYFTMQYIDGRGLDEVIVEARERARGTAVDDAGADTSRLGPTWYRDAARIGLEAAEALAHAHAHGVLHRDVKPGNLMLDADGKTWVTDFGLCKEEGEGDLTQPGDLLGTFRYMAPERFHGESDVRGDIYGVGITLYELLARRPAYDDEDRATLAARILKERPRRLREHDPRVPEDLERIVHKAMAHDPALRYATAEALAADLRAFLEGRPISARTPSLGYVLRVAIKRHKPLAVTLTAAVLVLLASSIYYVQSLREKEAHARFRQYVADITAAESALRTGDTISAERILAQTPSEFRNWEWRHMRSRVDDSLRRYPDTARLLEHVVYAPDGRHFAVIADSEVWVLDTETGEIASKLAADRANRLAWNPDGSRLATTGWNVAEVWSWPEGERLWQAPIRGLGRGVAWSPTGDRVMTGTTAGSVLVLDAVDGREQQRFAVPSRVDTLAAHGTQSLVAVGSWDGSVTLFDLASETMRWSRRASAQTVHYVAFFAGDLVGAATKEHGVRLWTVDKGTEEPGLPHGNDVQVLVPSWDGARALTYDGYVLRLWDVASRERLLRIGSLGRSLKSVSFHPSGRRAVATTKAGTLTDWHLGDGRDPRILRGHMDDVLRIAIAPDGRRIATGGVGGVVRLWDAETSAPTRVYIRNHDWIYGLAYTADGTLLASSDMSGFAVVHDVRTDEVVHRIQLEARGRTHVALPPDGRRLLLAGAEGHVSAWDLETGARLHAASDSTRQIDAIVVSPDGRYLVTGDDAGVLRLRDPTTLKTLRMWTAHEGGVRGLVFHPSKPLFASVSVDHTLKLWDPRTGAEVGRPSERKAGLSANEDALESVAFSPDGTRIVTGGRNGLLRVWGTESHQLLATLQDGGGWIQGLAFSPDGARVVSGHGDGRARIWETTPLRERVTAIERGLPAREEALRIVDALEREEPDEEERLRRLVARAELEPAVREAALRLVHQRRGTRGALLARLWSDLSAPDTDPERLRIARGVADSLSRAAGHLARQDRQLDVLSGMAAQRNGDAAIAVRWLGRARRWNADRDPALHGSALAFTVMAEASLGNLEDARNRLQELDALLASDAAARTPRNVAFRAEAQAALQAAEAK
ncbi:MAG: protein kinase [Planctomycetota bacterium]|nr:protein kinase [Planctomycetota bacterium]